MMQHFKRGIIILLATTIGAVVMESIRAGGAGVIAGAVFGMLVGMFATGDTTGDQDGRL